MTNVSLHAITLLMYTCLELQQNTRSKVIVMQLTEHGSLFNMLEDASNAYGLPEDEFLIVFEHVSK